MHLITLSAIVILFLLVVAFGVRMVRGLRTNTTSIFYKAWLVLLFIMMISAITWQLFQFHIL